MSYAKGTEVPVERSRFQIEHILGRYGAESFAYATSKNQALIAFTLNNRKIKMIVPIPDPNSQDFSHNKAGAKLPRGAAEKRWEQELRRRWRALLLVIKAKLEAVESGISEFEVEFMPYTVLPGGKTVADEILPKIQEAYESGKKIPLLGSGL